MQKTVLIDGMMCQHCEAHMKKAFESISGVASASPSHDEKCAVLELTADVPDDVLKQAVTAAGYRYLGIKAQ